MSAERIDALAGRIRGVAEALAPMRGLYITRGNLDDGTDI